MTKNAGDEIAPPVICGWHGVQAGALKCIVDQKQFSLVEPKISNIKPSLHHGLRADIFKKNYCEMFNIES